MADTIERLYKITVDGTAAVRALQQIAASSQATDDKLKAFTDTVTKLGKELLEAFGAKEIIDRIKGTSEAMDQLGKDAQKIGIGVEELQRLRYAAEFAGVGSDEMQKSVAALSVGIQHMGLVADDATKTLKAIGVKGGDSATEALEKIADRFAKMPDGVEKTAEAVALFGKKVGPELIPWLNQGSAGIKKMTDEADRFGVVLSQSTIDAAAEFNDNLLRMQKTTEGAWKEVTAGLLPAMTAISQAFLDAKNKGDDFKEAGAGVGEVLIKIAEGAQIGWGMLKTFGQALGAVFAAALAPTDQEKEAVWSAFGEDARKNLAATTAALQKLEDDFAKAKTKMAAPDADAKTAAATNVIKDQDKAIKDLAAAHEHAALMAKVHADAAAELVKIEEQEEKTTQELADQHQRLERELHPLEAAISDVKDAAEEADKIEQQRLTTLSALAIMLEEGTEAQKKFAAAQILQLDPAKKQVEATKQQSEELKIFTSGFDRFVDSLSSGSVTVAQAFKGMVESIIADLLKMWAKKYILDAFASWAGGGAAAAQGAAFDSGQVMPFARGGVVTSPVMLPMALMGEAGPEAVMPLKRTASGNLGVAASAAPMNITINNNTDATVTAQRTDANNLEIFIDRARAAIAADIRSGGNNVATSLERTYGIGRGSAAAY